MADRIPRPIRPAAAVGVVDEMSMEVAPYCGTYTGYTKGCRCDGCRNARNEYRRAYSSGVRKGRGNRLKPVKHGTANAYVKRNCRCRECVLWHRTYKREAYRRKKGDQLQFTKRTKSICITCGKDFVPRKDALNCSPACGAKSWRDRQRQKKQWATDTGSERSRTLLKERVQAEIAAGSPELAELIAEQERDDRIGHLVSHKWLASLDAALGDDGSELGELIGSDALDPATICIAEEEAAAIRAAIGDRSEDQLRRLDYRTLEYLGAKLQEQGLVSSITVTQAERRRLRDPQRHTGERVLASGSFGGKAKRREKVSAQRHSHPSQKPRKRWNRDVWEEAA